MTCRWKITSHLIAVIFLLSACADVRGTITPLGGTPTHFFGSPSPVASSTKSVSTPLPIAISPTVIPCDTSQENYCTLPGTFILQRPIDSAGTIEIDPTYAYASTSGGTRVPHHGVEFPNPAGTPVLAAADGIVVFAGDDSNTRFSDWVYFYGNLIVLEHDFPGLTLYTLYAHLSQVEVSLGQSVQLGSRIGKVGATGAAIGSHLHFEVRLDPQDYYSTLNPELFLVPPAGTGVLSIRMVNSAGEFVSPPISVQYFPDPDTVFTNVYQPDIYPYEILRSTSWENALVGNLLSGNYRIIFEWEGVWHERWVEVQTGKLTRTEFILDH